MEDSNSNVQPKQRKSPSLPTTSVGIGIKTTPRSATNNQYVCYIYDFFSKFDVLFD